MRCLLVALLMFSTNLSTKAQDGVILLHGLARSKDSMNKMETALKQAGFLVVNIDYPSRTASIDELSETTISDALKNETLRECPRIHFVTHSMGGILVRDYFRDHIDKRLGRVVMLGPPNQGSEVVDKLSSWKVFRKLNGPAGSELGTSPDSKPNQLGTVDFELGVIAGDRSINWINSMMIEGQDDGKVSVEHTKVDGMKEHLTLHATHPYLMKNKTAIQQTILFLKTGAFSPDDTPR